MSDLEYVRTYIDDLLLTTKSDSQDHLHHLDVVFHRIKDAGLKVNTRKSFFARDELEYLGYWITWELREKTIVCFFTDFSLFKYL